MQDKIDHGDTRGQFPAAPPEEPLTAWHTRTIEYAGRFTEFDLMWEGKDKNLGAAEIARHLTGAI